MPNSQAELTVDDLVLAIRLNMCDLFRHMSRTASGAHVENHRFSRWHTLLPHPWFSGVLAAEPPREDDGAFIEETIRFFRSTGVGAFTWWMEPPLRPADWESALSKHGFGFSDDTPGMAVDLHELDDSVPDIEGLEIKRVDDKSSMRIWANVFTYGYGLPPDWESFSFDVWMQMGLDFPFGNYVGHLNGKPVSTSTVFYGGGAAGIYAVATLPEARGKGIGAALTLRPLLEARAAGYRIGVLQSSEMGFNVYKQLGFRHLCQIESFYWRNQ